MTENVSTEKAGGNTFLESLGLTIEELQDRFIDRLCEQVCTELRLDEDGDEVAIPSGFSKRLNDVIRNQIDSSIAALAKRHVLPHVDEMIKMMILTETTRWGETIGRSLTFTEFLVARAEAYMVERVDLQGKSRSESGSSYFEGKNTRIAYLIDKRLSYEISTAMQGILKEANNFIIGGIETAVKTRLEEIGKRLKVEVKTS